MAVLTINQYIDAIDSFVDNVKNSKNAYYLFYGKIDPWVNSVGANDDTAVPDIDRSIYSYEQSTYNDMLFGKLITEQDIARMIPRYDWISGTTYQSYDQNNSNMYDGQFYVVTDSYEVYKCIYNNDFSPSTIKPAVTSPKGIFTTGDGYVWKYMFTVSPYERYKFQSLRYLPVTPDPDVVKNAIKGSIDHIKVITGGNNYHAHHDGFLQNFTNTTVVQISNSSSTESGKYTGSSIYLIAGYGAGQLRKIYDYKGPSHLVTVDQPFETSIVLNIENYSGNFDPGNLATQRTEQISFSFQKGYFNSLDNVIQSDTKAAGSILSANATHMRVLKHNETANDFSQQLPIINTSDSKVKIGSSRVNVTTNTVTEGKLLKYGDRFELYGSGYTANSVCTITPDPSDGFNFGILAKDHVNSDTNTIALTYSNGTPFPARVGDANYGKFSLNDKVFYSVPTGNTRITGLLSNTFYYISYLSTVDSKNIYSNTTSVDGTANTIKIALASSSFSLNDEVYYSVPTGNTPITGLNGNSYYYISFVNSSSIAVSETQSGPNVNITANSLRQTHVIRNTGNKIALSSTKNGANVNITASLINETHGIVGGGGGRDAVANAQASNGKNIPLGRIEFINIENWGGGYSIPPLITVDPPEKISFNANSSVDNTVDFINLGSKGVYFQNADIVTYSVDSGNSVLTNLSNNGVYYTIFANSTGFKLTSQIGSQTPIKLYKGLSQSGHYIQGETAQAILSTNTIYVNAASATSWSSSPNAGDIHIGDFIQVGDEDNKNIRRVVAVNSSVITVNHPFSNSLTSANLYTISNAVVPSSIKITSANGVISNTNLNSLTLTYANSVSPSKIYTVGEKIDMVAANDRTLGANGIVAFSNDSVVILTSVLGTFISGNDYFIKGAATLQKSNIIKTNTFPNITLADPEGTFLSGQKIFIKTNPALTNVGSATLISSVKIPNESTKYIISPTVTIEGDGRDAKAFAVVNTNFDAANNIVGIQMLNPGTEYTYANVKITVNPKLPTYGKGATAAAIISPIAGHGADPYKELGARYAGISMTIDKGLNEEFKFPVHGSYRKVGIIENPLFDEVTLRLDSFDRVNLTLDNKFGSGFSVGEYCYQSSNSSATGVHAAGLTVSANSTFLQLRNVYGEFSNNTANNRIYGLTSGTVADVMLANVIYFTLSSNVQIVSETKSGATATIKQVDSTNSSILKLTNVSGRFDANDTLFDTTSNASANVVSIYLSNNTVDATTNFGNKFTQYVRLSLSSQSSSFKVGELVTQETTKASGELFDNTSDVDIYYQNRSGLGFNIGDLVTQDSGGTGTVIYVYHDNVTHNGYLRLTAVTGVFLPPGRINNTVGVGADLKEVQPVLLLKNIKFPYGKFQNGNYVIRGANSKAIGLNQNDETKFKTILYPDLVRNSGKVIYLENVSPISRNPTSKEQINLIIKF